MRNTHFRNESIYRWAQVNVILPTHIWEKIKTPGIYFDEFKKILAPFFYEAIEREVEEYNVHIHEDLHYDEDVFYVTDFSDECPWARLSVL